MDVKDELVESIRYFRTLDFFQPGSQGGDLSDEELALSFLSSYKDKTGTPFDPEGKHADLELTSYDKSRVWWEDTEADVARANNEYYRTLQEWALISRGAFQPEDITETWESEEGPILVSFTLDGKSYTVEPEWDNDWLDMNILIELNQVIAASGYAFEMYDEFDQTAFVVVLTAEEKERLQSERGWLFEY